MTRNDNKQNPASSRVQGTYAPPTVVHGEPAAYHGQISTPNPLYTPVTAR